MKYLISEDSFKYMTKQTERCRLLTQLAMYDIVSEKLPTKNKKFQDKMSKRLKRIVDELNELEIYLSKEEG